MVAEKVRRLLVFQRLTMPGEETDPEPRDLDLASRHRLTEPDWPRLAFIETTFCRDPTNWWVPNHAAIVSLLGASGSYRGGAQEGQGRRQEDRRQGHRGPQDGG